MTYSGPIYGEEIQPRDANGDFTDYTTKVVRVVSHDRHEGLWEVVDNFNQTRIVCEAHPGWEEVIL